MHVHTYGLTLDAEIHTGIKHAANANGANARTHANNFENLCLTFFNYISYISLLEVMLSAPSLPSIRKYDMFFCSLVFWLIVKMGQANIFVFRKV